MRLSRAAGLPLGFRARAQNQKRGLAAALEASRAYRRRAGQSQSPYVGPICWRRYCAVAVSRFLRRVKLFVDWLLASLHHLAVFSLAGILSAEIFLTAGPIDDRMALRLVRVDAWFGILAALVIAAGRPAGVFWRQGLRVLCRQHLLLGQDGPVRRGRAPLGRADLLCISSGAGGSAPTRRSGPLRTRSRNCAGSSMSRRGCSR